MAKVVTCSGAYAHEHLGCASSQSQIADERVPSGLGCSIWSAPVLVDVCEAFWCQGMLECAATASKARRVLRHVSRMKLEAFASREKSACSSSRAVLGSREHEITEYLKLCKQKSSPLQMLTQWSSINAAFGIKKKTALIICVAMLWVRSVNSQQSGRTSCLYSTCCHFQQSTCRLS